MRGLWRKRELGWGRREANGKSRWVQGVEKGELDRVRRNRGEDEEKNKMKDQLAFLRATLHFI